MHNVVHNLAPTKKSSTGYTIVSAEMIGDRIKELRDNTSLIDFSILFSIHRNTLRAYESNKRFPDSRLISEICNKYQVHADWLLLGKGPKYRGDAPPAELDQEILSDAIAALEDALKTKGRQMTPDQKAEIITEIYLLISEDENKSDKENLTRLLRLVA